MCLMCHTDFFNLSKYLASTEAPNITNQWFLHFHVDRYFIVIDDVWDVPTWEAIKLSLVENNCGSKVITTTRKFDVANEAGDVYKLKPLSDDDSMKLLYTRIFGAEGKYHDKQPEDVINKIVKKCGGCNTQKFQSFEIRKFDLIMLLCEHLNIGKK